MGVATTSGTRRETGSPPVPGRIARTAERRIAPAVVGVVGAGAALALLLAVDGDPIWRLVRPLLVLAATWAYVERRRTVGGRWGLATFVLGAALFACGTGLAVPHLTKTGLTLQAVVGVVVLGGGTGLVVSGGRQLLATVHGWAPRVLLVPLLLAVLAMALYVIGQAVAVTNVPRTAVGGATPADHGLTYAHVRFPARDGVTLDGWYVPSRNGAAVALLHGAGSTRSAVLDHAAVLAGRGYGVLLFDARGHGESDGRAMDFGWYGDDDVVGAVTFLDGRPDVGDAIGLVGLSMGGEEALGAAAADGRVDAVVAEGATGRQAADDAWLSDVYGVRGWLHEGLEHLTYGLTDLLTDARPPTGLADAVAAAAPRPVLLVAAGDLPDEQHAARHVQAASAGSVTVWVVPDAGHTEGLAVAPQAWEARVVGFLDRELDPAP